MPVTLAQAALNATTDLDLAVIDEFRTSQLLDLITFKDTVNPEGGGDVLQAGYTRLITTGSAGFRAYNTEYTPGEVTKQRYTVDLKPLGGSFQIDRVLAKVGAAAQSEVALQMAQKIKATQAKFSDAMINGDSAVDANSFDGLSKALAGSSTESTTSVDLSGTHDEAWAYRVLEWLDDLLGRLDTVDASCAVVANKRIVNFIKTALRRAGAYTVTPGPRGSQIIRYGDNGPLIYDAGLKPGSASDVVPLNATDPDSGGPLTALSTAVFAVRFGLDGFHGYSVAGGQLVTQWMPDFTTAGAVKTGEVELGPVAVALKATKAAAVDRNVKYA